MLHSKIEEIIKFSLKNGGEEVIEELMYRCQLIKHILDLSTPEKRELVFESTQNKTTKGYFAFIISISNELIKLSNENSEIQNTLESIPEWHKFQEGLLKQQNDLLIGPLGGRDPRTKIDSLFDDNDFLGRFKGFKPVPFDSIKNRRKNMNRKQEDEVEQETEEEEDEDEDKLDFEDINKYYEDNDELIELDLQESSKPDFSKTSIKDKNTDRYATIDIDDDGEMGE